MRLSIVITGIAVILAALTTAVTAGNGVNMKKPALSELTVKGSKILDGRGKTIVLRGVNAASLEWTSDGEGHILETVRRAIVDWKANCVRLPLSQDRWFGKAPEQNGEAGPYRDLVRKAVNLCASNGAYIILDLHWSTAGKGWGTNIGQHSMPDVHSAEFWKDIAAVYANQPAVIFDLYNEPHDISWDVWLNGGQVQDRPNTPGQERATFEAVGMQALLDTVRGTGAKNVIVAGGLDWAYDMSGFLEGYLLKDPAGNGVIYANHAYDNKRESVFKWTGDMEKAAAKIPVIVAEFGGSGGPTRKPGWWGTSPSTAMGDDWLLHVLKVIREHNWSFTAWDLHPAASPCLIADWDYTPTPDFGVYVRQLLLTGKLPPYAPPNPAAAAKRPSPLPLDSATTEDKTVYGDWLLTPAPGDRGGSLLAFSAGQDGKTSGQWIDYRGVSDLKDVQFSASKVRFSQTVTFDSNDFTANFEGEIDGDKLSGIFTHGGARDTIEAGRIPEPAVREDRPLSPLVGNWNLEVKNDWGVSKQRLKVYTDLSGLYGTMQVKRIVLEGDAVNFTVEREWNGRKFEMNFRGKLEGSGLSGEISGFRGTMKVTGKKS